MSDSAYVAGWEDRRGEWHNVEAGDRPPSEDELAESDRISIAVLEKGESEPRYLTTSMLTPDYGIDDFLADSAADYGVEFV